jgi:hypothetical protein
MSSSRIFKDLYRKTNYKVLLWDFLGVIAANILIQLLQTGDWKQYDFFRVTLVALLSALLTGLIGFGLWEVFAKRTFAEEILEVANISKNLRDSGLLYCYDNFKEIDWREILSHSKKIKVFVSYAKTWREQHSDAIDAFLANGGEMTVYLPNYINEALMNQYDERFSYTHGKTKEYILESARIFSEKGCTVKLFDGVMFNSYYIIDDYCFIALSKHKKEKTVVPTLKFIKDGILGEFIERDFSSIEQQSTDFDAGR